jgi:hypothetical protein
VTWNIFNWAQSSPKTLTVSVKTSGTYGSEPNLASLPANASSITYDPAGESANVQGSLTCSTTATISSPVSGSPYSVSSCQGLSDPGFSVVYDYPHSGYSVTPAPLLVVPQNRPVEHGHALPVLTWSANFLNGDSAGSLSRQPLCLTAAKLDASKNVISPSGRFAITCSGAKGNDYTVSYRAGTLTVTLQATHLSYLGPTTLHAGKSAHLSASLKSDRGQPISGRSVALVLGKNATAVKCAGVTNGKGVATCVTKPKAGNASRDLTMTFAGDPPGAHYFFARTQSKLTVRVKA